MTLTKAETVSEMENYAGKTDQVTQLLQNLNNKAATRESRMDTYLLLARGVSIPMPAMIEDLSRLAVLILKHIKMDLEKDDSGLVQSALQLLGFLLHCPEIVTSFSGGILKSILEDICTVLRKTDDKGICARALWCLSKQNMPDDIISKELSNLLPVINSCLVGKNFDSSTVELEAINVFQRLLKHCPVQMIENGEVWFKMVYPFVISRNTKIAERSLVFLEKNLVMFKQHHEKLSTTLISDLQEGLVERLRAIFDSKRELFVLRVWSCFVTILDKNMHQGTRVSNSLLKVEEMAFKARSTDVLIAAYKAWQFLIDNFATSEDAICSQKRLKLLLMPLVNATSSSQRNANVEQARFDCWLHLIRTLKHKINTIFSQVINPFLEFLFSVRTSTAASVDLNLQKTPTKANGDEVLKVETPITPAARKFDIARQKSSPRNKNLHFDSGQLKKSGAEILYHLIKSEDSDDDPFETSVSIEFEPVSLDIIKKNAVIFTIALQDLTSNCGEVIDPRLLTALWGRLLCQFERIFVTAGDDKESITVIAGGLFLSLQTMVDSIKIPSKTVVNILTLCHEELHETMSQHKDLLKTELNTQGSFSIHLLQLILQTLKSRNDISTSNGFLGLFKELLASVMEAVTGQLPAVQQIIKSTHAVAPFVEDKGFLWRIWDAITTHLTEFVKRTNEVNQGGSLDHDFSAILDTLLFPVKELLKADMPMGVSKDLNSRWSALFKSLVRESSLIATTERNQAIEDFCRLLHGAIESQGLGLEVVDEIGKLIQLLTVVIESLEPPGNQQRNQLKMTPRSMHRRLGNPLGNVKSLVNVLKAIYRAFHSAKDSKTAEQHLGSFIEALGKYFSRISGDDVIKESVKQLSSCIVQLVFEERLKSLPVPIDVELESSKSLSLKGNMEQSWLEIPKQCVAKLLNQIYACVQEKYEENANQDLLDVFSPLLIAGISCENSVVRSRTAGFWNMYFGEVTGLVYSKELRAILNQMKTKIPLTINGSQGTDPVAIPESDDAAQLPDSTDITNSPNIRKTLAVNLRSPHKIHGSFLQKALSADRVPQSPSPRKKIVDKSPKSEPRIKAVRRKLASSLDHDNSNEFVTIAPSPKKRRILTEHQKDMLRSKSDVPTLYNMLDQTTQEAIFSEDTQCTMDFPLISSGKIDPACHAERRGSHSNDAAVTVEREATAEEPFVHIAFTQKEPDVMEVASPHGSCGGSQTKSGSPVCDIEVIAKCPKGDKEVSHGSQRSPCDMKETTGRCDASAPKARKSIKKSLEMVANGTCFDDSLSRLNETGKGLESSQPDDNDVIPSSYTPYHESSLEKSMPLESIARLVTSVASSSNLIVDDANPESSAAVSSSENSAEPSSLKANGTNAEGKTKHCEEPDSETPDLIPCTQPENEPLPVLKGVTLLTPRRSLRKSRKSQPIAWQKMRDENISEAKNNGSNKVSSTRRKSRNVRTSFKETEQNNRSDKVLSGSSVDINSEGEGSSEAEASCQSKKEKVSNQSKNEEVSSQRKSEKDSSQNKHKDVSSQSKNEEVSSQNKDEEVSIQSKNEEVPSQSKKEEVSIQNKNEEVSYENKDEEVSDQSKNEEVSYENKDEEVSDQSKNEEVSIQNKDETVATDEGSTPARPERTKEMAPEKSLDLCPAKGDFAGTRPNEKKASKRNHRKRSVISILLDSAKGFLGKQDKNETGQEDKNGDKSVVHVDLSEENGVSQDNGMSSTEMSENFTEEIILVNDTAESENENSTKRDKTTAEVVPIRDTTEKNIESKDDSVTQSSEDSNSIIGTGVFSEGGKILPARNTARKSIAKKEKRHEADKLPLKEFSIVAKTYLQDLNASIEDSIDLASLSKLYKARADKGSSTEQSKVGFGENEKEKNDKMDIKVTDKLGCQENDTKSVGTTEPEGQIISQPKYCNDKDVGLHIVALSPTKSSNKNQGMIEYDLTPTFPRTRKRKRKLKSDKMNSIIAEKVSHTSDGSEDPKETSEDQKDLTMTSDSFKVIESIAMEVTEAGVLERNTELNRERKETKSTKQQGIKPASPKIKFSHGLGSTHPSSSRSNCEGRSPISGILKMALKKSMESSPSGKSRRVSFAIPLEDKRWADNERRASDLAVPFPKTSEKNGGTKMPRQATPKRFTAIQKKLSSPKIARQDDTQAIFPDLIKCRTVIEKILPSITSMSWSRGAGNFFRSQNIRTIGDLCALSESQIESLPIRSPKVCVCKTALSRFLKQQEKQMATHTAVSKSGSPTKVKSQIKEENSKNVGLKKAEVNETPTKKGSIKATLLFRDLEENEGDREKEEAGKEDDVTEKFDFSATTCDVDVSDHEMEGSKEIVDESSGKNDCDEVVVMEDSCQPDDEASQEKSTMSSDICEDIGDDDEMDAENNEQENDLGNQAPKEIKIDITEGTVLQYPDIDSSGSENSPESEELGKEEHAPILVQSSDENTDSDNTEDDSIENSRLNPDSNHDKNPDSALSENPESEAFKCHVTSIVEPIQEVHENPVAEGPEPTSQPVTERSLQSCSDKNGTAFDKEKSGLETVDMDQSLTRTKVEILKTEIVINGELSFEESTGLLNREKDCEADTKPEDCCQMLDKALSAIKNNLSRMSLKQSVNIHRTLFDFNKLMLDSIETKIDDNS
ncbi:telomere-associated protein RIF1-like isoform X2 [Rhopilema esculentum]|uniref:telomere-associated protein RIF1-like isoform X2 n=1 Tax=Rhopilema esculentum TaxID=499914 RepID=UPI0031D23D9A